MTGPRVKPRSAAAAAPRPMSEADVQAQVVRHARDLGWGASLAAWKRDSAELEACGQPRATLSASGLEAAVWRPADLERIGEKLL